VHSRGAQFVTWHLAEEFATALRRGFIATCRGSTTTSPSGAPGPLHPKAGGRAQRVAGPAMNRASRRLGGGADGAALAVVDGKAGQFDDRDDESEQH